LGCGFNLSGSSASLVLLACLEQEVHQDGILEGE
jgi:hypothetical protein